MINNIKYKNQPLAWEILLDNEVIACLEHKSKIDILFNKLQNLKKELSNKNSAENNTFTEFEQKLLDNNLLIKEIKFFVDSSISNSINNIENIIR